MEEPPKDGEGFPLPEGGWKYGKSIFDNYYYTKEESYIEKMRQVEYRVTFQLAHNYIEEMNQTISSFEQSLTMDDLIVIYDDEESIISLIFKYNMINHKRVKIDEIHTLTLTPGKQGVILSDAPIDLKDDIKGLDKLADFVNNGGFLLSFNTGGVLLNKIFPDKIKLRNGVSTVDKQINVELSMDKECENIFKLYKKEIDGNRKLIRRRGLQRFSIVDEENAKVFLTEVAPHPNQPLVVQWKVGKGVVFHSLLSHVVASNLEEIGNDYQGLSDMLETPSRSMAESIIKEIETLSPENPPLSTIKSWKAAFSCGYYIPVNMAKSMTLPIDFLFELLNKLLKK